MKRKLPATLLFSFLCCAIGASAQTINPVSVRKLDSAASGVAWLDSERLIVAGSSGVRLLSLRDGQWSELIPTTPVPKKKARIDGHIRA